MMKFGKRKSLMNQLSASETNFSSRLINILRGRPSLSLPSVLGLLLGRFTAIGVNQGHYFQLHRIGSIFMRDGLFSTYFSQFEVRFTQITARWR
jgi:hypothetical protein